MAEERNVGIARATSGPADEDLSKEELQRRMDEARADISQTVAEIKDTVTSQYEYVRTTISETLDWREQFRRRPLALSLGALGVGFVLGYSIGGAFGGDYDDYEDDDYDMATTGVRPLSQRSFAAQAIVGPSSSYGTSSTQTDESHSAASASDTGIEAVSHGAYGTSTDVTPAPRPSYSSGYEADTAASADTAESQEPQKPGIIDRLKESGLVDKFKETKAYDRLQDELAKLGERAVNELSRTAQTVVLPALLSKLKDMIGLDLSGQGGDAQQQRGLSGQQGTQTQTANTSASNTGGVVGGGGTSQATGATAGGTSPGVTG